MANRHKSSAIAFHDDDVIDVISITSMAARRVDDGAGNDDLVSMATTGVDEDEEDDAAAGAGAAAATAGTGDDATPRAVDGGVVAPIARSLNRRRIQSTAS